MDMTNDKADFTQGSILKKLIAFMIPILGALILQAERALNMRLDEAVSDKNKNARLYKSLGFYFGILLVIMFF